MKVSIKGIKKVSISSEFIKLDSLLKFAAIASTGGEAKILIKGGEVFVNGEVCLERGKKIRPGDIVKHNNISYRIFSSNPDDEPGDEGMQWK